MGDVPAVADKATQLRAAMPDLYLPAIIRQVPAVLTLVRAFKDVPVEFISLNNTEQHHMILSTNQR